jgi:nucleolar protein 14
MQRRNKVGGLIDRRFGEDDPTMTPEQKAAERFAREKQRSWKKNSLFDLEDYGPETTLTHLGRSLSLEDGSAVQDDFDEPDLFDDDDDTAYVDPRRLKRLRGEEDIDENDDGGEGPQRKKTKNEVMKEVIAKSKLHKYERQTAKEADDDARVEIDKQMAKIRPLLLASKETVAKAVQNGEPLEPQKIAGMDKDAFEKEYDARLRRMILDRRAQPSDRTKTEDELAAEQAELLKDLEEKRQKRMTGQPESDDENSNDEDAAVVSDADAGDDLESDQFGLGKGTRLRPTATELGLEDEDDFIIEDDLVASGSDIDSDGSFESLDGESDNDEVEDDEFTKGLLEQGESLKADAAGEEVEGKRSDDKGVPYTFPCPQSHLEWLRITQDLPTNALPTVIQRIRALHHAKLDSGNKQRLGNFATVLVQHVAYLGDLITPLEASNRKETFAALETTIRHVHSMAKTYGAEIGKQFRQHIQTMEATRPLDLTTGDLMVLTAVGSVFSTSDSFHHVVLPAQISMARCLDQRVPRHLNDYVVGSFLSLLSLQYQATAKRYVPEIMVFSLSALLSLSPVKFSEKLRCFPDPLLKRDFRIKGARHTSLRKLDLGDCQTVGLGPEADENGLKIAILMTVVDIQKAAAEMWAGKPAFLEAFDPISKVLKHFTSKGCKAHLPANVNESIERFVVLLDRMFQAAKLARRPLELHNHRPVAIRMKIPKFEDNFDPDKHYDPNRERAESAKLRKEYRRERKGAVRELRKDSRFMAREKLRIKKAKDEAYEKKYKRLVAEIQGEEGQAANEYEREKTARKKAAKRGKK